MKKADMIREVAQTMKRPIRPLDVIATVREKHGATVTSPQVSKILKTMGLKRKSRRRGKRRGRCEQGGADSANRS